MKTKANPIITQTEIISRAIRSIEEEISECRHRCDGLPQEMREQMFNTATKELVMKQTALRTMYLFETGTEYV